MTRFPVGPQEESFRTEAKHASNIGQTSVRTSPIVYRTVAGVLAVQAVGHQAGAGQILAGACKASEIIVARVLAGSVSVAQQALVDVLYT